MKAMIKNIDIIEIIMCKDQRENVQIIDKNLSMFILISF
jgi:hypothetical protein